MDIDNRFVFAKGGWGGGMESKFRIRRGKLIYILIEWINNKVLLYRTGNYIQYPVINHNEKECIYMCITSQKLTCKLTVLQ